MKIVYDRIITYVKRFKDDDGYFCYHYPSEKPCFPKYDTTKVLLILDNTYFKKPAIEKYK